MNLRITDLKVGEKGEIIGYENTNEKYLRKILSMGLTKGTEFKVIKIAPLGDPIEIEVRGFKLSLRKDEGKILKLRRIE